MRQVFLAAAPKEVHDRMCALALQGSSPDHLASASARQKVHWLKVCRTSVFERGSRLQLHCAEFRSTHRAPMDTQGRQHLGARGKRRMNKVYQSLACIWISASRKVEICIHDFSHECYIDGQTLRTSFGKKYV